MSGNASLGTEALGFMAFTLELAEGVEPEIGQQFGLLRYGGLLSGYFDGMSPNSTTYEFEQDGQLYALDYSTGEDSMITLTVIPEPHTLGLLLAAGLMLTLRRRIR